MKISKNFSLQKRLLVSFLIFSLIPLLILGTYASLNLQQTVYNEKKDSLKRAVNIANSIVQDYYDKYINGIYNESFAQFQALETLKILRYGDQNKDYFWVQQEVNSKPYMVMHPFTTQLVGQDLSDYKDPNGIYLFNEMDAVVNAHGSGFVEYSWQYYDNADLIEPKLSYVFLSSGWNWIIGTGFYIQDVNAIMMNQLSIFAGLVFGTIVIILLSTYFVSNSISKPIQSLSNSNALLADGDLREEIIVSSRHDEIGKLTKSHNKTQIFLRDIISELNSTSESLFTSANDIAASSEEVSASSEEISAISQQMSKGSIEQTHKVGESVEQVSEFEILFKSKIKSIKDTSNLIQSITSQVNMLALNASIEAARAGEYGRGFAVVADNIRQLADTTKVSLNEVNSKVEDIEVNLIDALIAIKNSIDSVSAISEETASGSEEASASIEEQSASLQELSSKSQELANIARKLQGIVHKFKI